MSKGTPKLYTIGSQSRTLKQWREILGELPNRLTIYKRMKDQRMTFIEAITYVKPDIIYVGEVFNRIEVLEAPIKKSTAKCKALCHCGKEFNTNIRNLKAGNIASCGCSRKKPLKHGLSNHPLYIIWYHMNDRCNNPNDKSYKNYGALGVTVCWDWHQDNPKGLQNFIEDMYPSYLKATKDGSKVQLDKDIKAIPGQIKVYSKQICCWLPPIDNNRKKSTVYLDVAKVAEIKNRIAKGDRVVDIAFDYSVNARTISNIKRGTAWKDV